MKKIAHIFWSLTFGGVETMLINIANAQAELGADVYVFIVNDMIESELLRTFSNNVHMVLLRRKVGSRNPFPVFKLNKILLSLNPDAIHIHESDLFGCLWFKRLSRVTSVTLHALPSGTVRRDNLLCKFFKHRKYKDRGNVVSLDKIPRVFAISDAVHDMLRDKYGIESIVVNNGILTSKFEQKTDDEWHSPFRIIQVSRLDHEKKGQDLLIEAAAKLKGAVDVTFIGNGASMVYLKELTAKLDIDKNVHFLGKRTQSYIAQHLKDYDLFVQASRWEGFGLTVAEAMAAKVPVLVSEGQGPAEVTCGEKYGWLFKNGDADELTRQIQYIKNNKEQVLHKAEVGCLYVCNTYDVAVTAKRYLGNYIYK